jgi:Icc protein
LAAARTGKSLSQPGHPAEQGVGSAYEYRLVTSSKTTAEMPSDRTLRILQLTDTHLYADPEGRLLGQNTRRTLELVLEMANSTCSPIDLVLLTGDLVHDESPQGYDYLRRRLVALDTPCYCLPGNHDQGNAMSRSFDGLGVSMETAIRCGAWNLVLLDSTVPGTDGGHLDAGQLARLQDSLAERQGDPTLICLHHQPVPVGSTWIDTMALDNPDALFGIVDRHPQVRGILWGHIHQEFCGMRKCVLLMGSPSTCVQFMPGSEKFALDALTPGFRWLDLHPDGRIDTGVKRIEDYPDPIELGTGGY